MRTASPALPASPALLALLALLAVLVLLAPSFFAPDNLRDVVISNAMVQIIAVGMTMVILTGQVDVAVGATAGVCAVLSATLAREGMPPLLAALAATLAGGLIGLISGFLVARLRLPSIVVTLALLVILRDGLRWTTDGAWVGGLPASFQWFGLGQGGGQTLLIGLAVAVIAAGSWFLWATPLGRAVYATGSDTESAQILGLRPDRVVMTSFVACGVLTGLAAALNASRFAEVPGTVVTGLEMKVIAAVVVGGTVDHRGPRLDCRHRDRRRAAWRNRHRPDVPRRERLLGESAARRDHPRGDPVRDCPAFAFGFGAASSDTTCRARSVRA